MRRSAFDRRLGGTVDLDLCFDCRGIWFDQYESTQLSPAAVIALFGEIHRQGENPPRPMPKKPACPRCRTLLAFTHDLQRTNRITYYRCINDHGRFTTFMQFLREKNFVRSLAPAEVARLRVHVAQVRCSSCGAPVDLEVDGECKYCHAPIAILDADAVQRTLAELSRQERQRKQVDPTAAIDALLAGQRVQRRLAVLERQDGWSIPNEAIDLVGDALHLIFDA